MRIFGVVKKKLGRLFYQALHRPGCSFFLIDAIDAFQQIFLQLTPALVRSSWNCYLEDGVDDEDDENDPTYHQYLDFDAENHLEEENMLMLISSSELDVLD